MACFMDHYSLCRAHATQFFFLLLMFSLSIVNSTACSNGNCQVLDSCAAATDCGPGLYCGNCPALGKNRPICTRGQATIPTTIQPAINTLREVEAFLSQYPTEIVTIIIEDYVQTPKGLTSLFVRAGLDKYFFPVSKMPKKGEDWPTVTEMVQKNYRLLVFSSVASKEAEEGIAYQWRYILENESGDPGVKAGSCPHRKESQPLNSRKASLFLQNYFPTYPVEEDACKEHSTPLAEMVGTCYKAAGNLLPNFLAVNFYMRSDGGGVFDVLDKMNGQTLCGCSTVLACQVCPNTYQRTLLLQIQTLDHLLLSPFLLFFFVLVWGGGGGWCGILALV
ncbi:PI-PLC X domain-containing protein [Citrus sinensis]|uniref:PI-PLC X domain-containing protein n=1 Tax=Citrus sinensis TaxID=2711 RepID=A0ACB8J2J2_CITSI|nr:PI-PLC X domain-containing protein [Citrus sinensis]